MTRHPEKRLRSAVQDLQQPLSEYIAVGDSVSSSLRLMYGMTDFEFRVACFVLRVKAEAKSDASS